LETYSLISLIEQAVTLRSCAETHLFTSTPVLAGILPASEGGTLRSGGSVPAFWTSEQSAGPGSGAAGMGNGAPCGRLCGAVLEQSRSRAESDSRDRRRFRQIRI